MEYANPRNIWRDYILKCIYTAKQYRSDIVLFVHNHQQNKLPKSCLINETTVLLNLNKDDLNTLTYSDKTYEFNLVLKRIINDQEQEDIVIFSIVDIIQLTLIEYYKDFDNRLEDFLSVPKQTEIKVAGRHMFKKFRGEDIKT